MHVATEPHVEQRRARADTLAGAGYLRLALSAEQVGGELSGQILATALEHGHLEAHARQARGGDPAAIAGTDHHSIVFLPYLSGRPAEARHTLTPPHTD